MQDLDVHACMYGDLQSVESTVANMICSIINRPHVFIRVPKSRMLMRLQVNSISSSLMQLPDGRPDAAGRLFLGESGSICQSVTVQGFR